MNYMKKYITTILIANIVRRKLKTFQQWVHTTLYVKNVINLKMNQS